MRAASPGVVAAYAAVGCGLEILQVTGREVGHEAVPGLGIDHVGAELEEPALRRSVGEPYTPDTKGADTLGM